LAKGWGEIDAIAKESADSVGYSAKENVKAMQTFSKQVEVFKSSIKELYISVGEAGLMTTLKGVANGATSIAQALSKADPGMKKWLFTLLEVGVVMKSFSSASKIFTGLNFTQFLDKTGINGLSALTGGYQKSTTAAKAYQVASASLSAQVAAGNITATESAGILQVVGTKLGLASTSTNVLSAAQTGLQSSLARGIALESSLNAQVTAGTLSAQGRKAELLQRMFSEKELQGQLASGIITQEEYNLALRRRSIYEAGVQGQVAAGTITQAQADGLLKQKIITQEQYNIVIAQTSASLNVSTASTAGQTASNEALNASQKAVTAGAWVMKAAMLAGVLILTVGITAIIKMVQAQKNAVQDMQSALDTINNKTSSIDGLITEHEELAKKTSLTAEETKRYGEVVKQLNKLLPDSSSIIRDQTLSIEEQTSAMKKNNAELDKAATKKSIDDAAGNYDKSKGNITKQEDIYDSASEVSKGKGVDYEKAYASKKAEFLAGMGVQAELTKEDLASIDSFVISEANKTRDTAYNSMTKSKEIVAVYSAWFKKLAEDGVVAAGITGTVATNIINSFDKMGESGGINKDKIISYSDSLVELGKEDIFKQFSKSVDEFNKKTSHTPGEIDKQKVALSSLLASQKNSMPTTEYELFSKILAETLSTMGIATEKATIKAKTLADVMTTVTKAMETTTPIVSSINTILEKHAETNEWDTASILKLASTYPSLLAVMNDDKLLAQELTKIKGDNIVTVQKAAKDELQVTADKIKKIAGAYLTDIANFKTAIDAKNAYLMAYAANLDIIQKKFETLGKASGATDEESYYLGKKASLASQASSGGAGETVKSIDDYFKLKNIITSVDTSLQDVGKSKEKVTKGTKALTDANKQATNAINDQKQAIKELDNQLKLLAISQSKLAPNSDAYIAGLDKEAILIKKKITLTQQSIKTNEANVKSMLSVESATNKSSKSTMTSNTSSGNYAGGYANGKYKDWINQSGSKYGIDPNLIAGIIQTESSFNPLARNSKSGATGLGQFLYSTAKEEGLSDRTDAKSSIDAIAKYLVKRISWAGGDVEKAIMGYGEGTRSYLNKVKNNTPGGKSSFTSSTGESTTDNGSDKLKAQIEQDKADIADWEEKLAGFAYQKFNIRVAQYDDKIAEYESKNDILSSQAEITDDDLKRKGYEKEIVSNLNKELDIKKQEIKLVEDGLKSGKYTKAQLQEMIILKSKLLKMELDTTLALKTQAKERVTSLLESRRVSDEIALKQQQDNEKNKLASSIYGGVPSKTITVNTEIDKEMLQKKYSDLDITVKAGAGETGANRNDTLALNEKKLAMKSAEDSIKIYDKENQKQQDAIQTQIDNLNTVNDINKEIEDRLKNQNDLIEKQTALQNTLKEKNVMQIKQGADGKFTKEYIADPKAIESAQKALNDQVKSNADFEKSIALKHQTDSLNALKKSLADEKTAKDLAYSEKLVTLEKDQLIETNLLTLHYADMNLLADTSLKLLKKTYGDNWVEIIKQLTTDVDSAKSLQDSLLLSQANGTLSSTVKGTTGVGNSASITVNTEVDKAMLQAKYGSGVNITVSKGGGATGSDRAATLLLNEKILSGKGVVPKFASGGEVGSFSGNRLAMVDTKERVLSSTQTQDFGQLVSYLPSALISMENIMDKINMSNTSGHNNQSVVAPIIHNYHIDKVVANNVDEFISSFKTKVALV